MNDTMNNATQSYNGGISYSEAYIASDWGGSDDNAGEIDYDATYEMLADKVVELFESMVKQKLGAKVSWCPALSEVYYRRGDVVALFPDGEDSEICPLDEIREDAQAKIWEDWCNGDIAQINVEQSK